MRSVEVLGAAMVKVPVPDAFPLSAILLMVYSYKMLMEPASKVSVPLTVVIRTRSSVLEVVRDPATVQVTAESEKPSTPSATQVLEFINVIRTTPLIVFAAEPVRMIYPAVDVAVVAPEAVICEPEPM